jgi:hypothetical protein
MKYKLVNPIIDGSFDTIYEGKTPIKAAHKCWMKLSNLLSNNVPSFAFTMKTMTGGDKDGQGEYHHYKVKEQKNPKDKSISYEMSEVEIDLSPEQKKKLDNLENESKKNNKGVPVDDDADDEEELEQIGGFCPSYSISTSNSYCNKYKSFAVTSLMPVTYLSYWPYMYNLDVVYIPNFIAPLNPYVTILF